MDRIEIGTVARAHGIRGELRVQPHDASSTVLLDVDRVWLGGVEHHVASARTTNGAILLAVDGVADRDAAERLRGLSVEILRAAVELAPGEYLLCDLPGCRAVDPQGRPLGEIVEVQSLDPQALLVLADERLEWLIPAIPEFVVAVDTAARRVVLDLPEDLPAEPRRPGRR
jgi:16S rRNA processing protein RimM